MWSKLVSNAHSLFGFHSFKSGMTKPKSINLLMFCLWTQRFVVKYTVVSITMDGLFLN